MVIDLQQIDASGAQQGFLLSKDRSPYCRAQVGNLNRMQGISLQFSKKEPLCGSFEPPALKDCIPLLHWLGVERCSRRLRVETDGGTVAHFAYSRHGFCKSCYRITLSGGEEILCYLHASNSFSYLCFYKDGVQIALAETYLVSTNGAYNHKLYLLDEYGAHADICALLVLHHANHTLTKSLSAQNHTVYHHALSFSRYTCKFDPTWRERHFPKENFWGRML